MNSICLSCVLFTRDNIPVKENQYIQVFIIWLTQIIKINALKSNDILYISIDYYMQSHYTSLNLWTY